MPIIMKDGIVYAGSDASLVKEMSLADYEALGPAYNDDTIYFINDATEDLNQALSGNFIVNLTLVNDNSFTVDVEYADILKAYETGDTIWFKESSQGIKVQVLQVTNDFIYASMLFNTIAEPRMATLTLYSNGQGDIQFGNVAAGENGPSVTSVSGTIVKTVPKVNTVQEEISFKDFGLNAFSYVPSVNAVVSLTSFNGTDIPDQITLNIIKVTHTGFIIELTNSHASVAGECTIDWTAELVNDFDTSFGTKKGIIVNGEKAISQWIDFPITFSTIPVVNVVVTKAVYDNSLITQRVNAYVAKATTTGFEVIVQNTYTHQASCTIDWSAEVMERRNRKGAFIYDLLSGASHPETIDFIPPFNSIPTVTPTFEPATDGTLTATVSNITPSSCTITMTNTGGGYAQFEVCEWVAEAVESDYTQEQVDFVLDETGKITGYRTNIGGADTVFPFSSGIDVSNMTLVHSKQGSNAAMSSTYTATENGTYLAICFSAGNTTQLNPSVTTTGNILASITTAASTANQAKIAINFIELNVNETVTGADPNATTSGRAAFVVYQLK